MFRLSLMRAYTSSSAVLLDRRSFEVSKAALVRDPSLNSNPHANSRESLITNFRLRRFTQLSPQSQSKRPEKRYSSFGRKTEAESRLLDETGHSGEVQRGFPLSNEFMFSNPGILVIVICLQRHDSKLKKYCCVKTSTEGTVRHPRTPFVGVFYTPPCDSQVAWLCRWLCCRRTAERMAENSLLESD